MAWHPYLTGDINKIENIQRRAARFVKNYYSRQSSVISKMNDLNWQPLSERRRDQRPSLFFKIVNGLVVTSAYIQFNHRPPKFNKYCLSDWYFQKFVHSTYHQWLNGTRKYCDLRIHSKRQYFLPTSKTNSKTVCFTWSYTWSFSAHTDTDTLI